MTTFRAGRQQPPPAHNHKQVFFLDITNIMEFVRTSGSSGLYTMWVLEICARCRAFLNYIVTACYGLVASVTAPPPTTRATTSSVTVASATAAAARCATKVDAYDGYFVRVYIYVLPL